MKEQKDIVIVDWGGRIPTDSEEEYLAHLLCLGGTCRYRFNERDFELHAGDLSIIRKRKLIERIEPSDDFRCKIIYVTPGFVELCTPQSNYGMKGQLALFLNPVMRLSPEQQIVCRRDFDLLEQASPIRNIVSTARRSSTPCRPPSSTSLIFMPASTVKATFPHRTLPS